MNKINEKTNFCSFFYLVFLINSALKLEKIKKKSQRAERCSLELRMCVIYLIKLYSDLCQQHLYGPSLKSRQRRCA